MSVLRIPADGEPKQAAQRGKGARRLKAVGPNVRRCCEDPRLRVVPTAATPDEGKVGDAKAQSAGRLALLREGRSPRVATPPRRGNKKAPAGSGSLAPRAFGARALRAAFAALACTAVVVMGLVVGSLLLPAERQTVVVQSGDTLWAIAARIDGAPSTPRAVTDIAQLNSLGSRDVKPGQKLVLPHYR